MTEKKNIESGIPGVKLCPKCLYLTCFVLPRFDFKTRDILEYCCPRCLAKKEK